MTTIGHLKLKAQVLRGGVTAMGPGKADLLEAIDQAGSISAAARIIGMSYRRAWTLVDQINQSFAVRLVETAHGGAKNGAQLTSAGRTVLAAYRALETRLAQAADGESLDAITALLKPSDD